MVSKMFSTFGRLRIADDAHSENSDRNGKKAKKKYASLRRMKEEIRRDYEQRLENGEAPDWYNRTEKKKRNDETR